MQTDNSVLNLSTNLIIPNKYQPRKVFDEISLNSLAESIKNYGIINPILVRKKDDKYEIIAGERRFIAAKKVGLTEVPVIVKTADEQQMAELALIENIQRQELSPIEEAKSYEEIMKIGNQTQQSLANKLGKSQSAIANKIRLLSLPQEIQDAIANKKISERHARCLITVKNKDSQLELLNRIITEKLTVKETEQIINEKEINEEEIKQAISDIMKSLNIKEEEKEDDNMNNGNFIPNFNNNNNNTSLNMMNMQSINNPEINMASQGQNPTMLTPEVPQMSMPQEQPTNQFIPFGSQPVINPTPEINNSFNPMDSFMNYQPMAPQDNSTSPIPTVETPMMNDAPLFGPQFDAPVSAHIDTQPQNITPEAPVMTPPLVDAPLFNPNIVIPPLETPMAEITPVETQLSVPEQPMMEPTSFEVPLSTPEPLAPHVVDRLTELQNLLSANGYNYKVYSNETDNCVIIELPKN